MTRVVLILLVVAVAGLAWRDRQRERRIVQLEADVAMLRQGDSARDRVAKALTGATLGRFISDPLKRQIHLDTVYPSEASRRKSLEPLCTRIHTLGSFPPFCEGVGIAVAPEPLPKGLDAR